MQDKPVYGVSEGRSTCRQAASLRVSPNTTQGHRVPHAIQDDVLRVALWYLMGGAAAESIMAAQEQRRAA